MLASNLVEYRNSEYFCVDRCKVVAVVIDVMFDIFCFVHPLRFETHLKANQSEYLLLRERIKFFSNRWYLFIIIYIPEQFEI